MLKTERQFFRVLDALLHFDKKCYCFLAIDCTMIVTQREIHHWAHFHFVVHSNWSRHDFMHAKNAALGWIQDRRGEQRSVHSAVCDGKGAALQIFDLQFAVARPASVIGDVTLQISKTFLARIAYDRHNEPALRADCYADIIEI